MADKYLEELRRTKPPLYTAPLRAGYRKGRRTEGKEVDISERYNRPTVPKEEWHIVTQHADSEARDRILKSSDYSPSSGQYEKGEVLGVARSLYRKGMKNQNYAWILDSAKLYEKIGLANRPSVKKRLLNAFKNIRNSGAYQRETEQFFLRNREETRGENSKLERVAATSSALSLIAGLLFLSVNITGNAVSDLNNSTSNSIGAGLIVVSLIAGFLFFKEKSKHKS